MLFMRSIYFSYSLSSFENSSTSCIFMEKSKVSSLVDFASKFYSVFSLKIQLFLLKIVELPLILNRISPLYTKYTVSGEIGISVLFFM